MASRTFFLHVFLVFLPLKKTQYSWISWIWIDTGSEQVALKAVTLARDAGVPIRHGLHGATAVDRARRFLTRLRQATMRPILFASAFASRSIKTCSSRQVV